MLDVIEHSHGIRELRLARPPVNALDPALTAALHAALQSAAADHAPGVVLSGAPGMFSAGLDIPALLALDRTAMRAFWGEFFGVCVELARAPMPVVAAITGHSPAGGAVFAIHCDYRVMARGDFRIGLNEVQVGLIVPECIQAAMRRLVGAYRAERLLVAGAMVDGETALKVGMVDALTELDAVVPSAITWLETLLAAPRAAMLGTRALARSDLARCYANPEQLPVELFLNAWFAPATQATLQALVARLRAKHA